MAKLSEMILGETARNLDLIDRPATLLRRGEVNRQQDQAAESALKTAKQGRTLATRADARADTLADLEARRVAVGEKGLGLEERRVATGEAGVELDKSGQALTARQVAVEESAEARAKEESEAEISELTQATEALKRKNQAEAQQVAQNFVAPVVQQMIEFHKQYIETGDPKMKEQRDKLLGQFSSNSALKSYVGILPQFAELAGLTDMHLYDPNMTEDQIEKEKLDLISGLIKSDQVYKKLQQDKANRAAAHMLLAEKKKAEGKASGEILGTAEAYTEVSNRGLELPPEEVSEGERTNIRTTAGDDILRSMGGLGFDKKAMAEFGLDRTTFAKMDHDVLLGEKRVFDAAKRSVLGGPQKIFGMELDFSDKAKAHASMQIIRDNAAPIQDATGVNVLSNDSPIMVAMEHLTKKYSDGWFWGRKSTEQRANKSPVFKGNFGSGN